jgi:hypothetical protein
MNDAWRGGELTRVSLDAEETPDTPPADTIVLIPETE